MSCYCDSAYIVIQVLVLYRLKTREMMGTRSVICYLQHPQYLCALFEVPAKQSYVLRGFRFISSQYPYLDIKSRLDLHSQESDY